MHQFPELLDAEAVERIAEAGPEAVAREVVPAAGELRRTAAVFGDLLEEVP